MTTSPVARDYPSLAPDERLTLMLAKHVPGHRAPDSEPHSTGTGSPRPWAERPAEVRLLPTEEHGQRPGVREAPPASPGDL